MTDRRRYRRACDYLAAAMIYLQDNVLLRDPLRPQHLKPRPLGHWGTCPGLNLVYSSVNQLLRRTGRRTLLIAGPGALHRRSGLLGLSGSSGDTRDLVRSVRHGDSDADLALRVFVHQATREIAAVAASLDRLDALVFTGDIGWDQPEIAESIASGLGILGFHGALSEDRSDDAVISDPRASVPVLAVKSREELEPARQAAAVPVTAAAHRD